MRVYFENKIKDTNFDSDGFDQNGSYKDGFDFPGFDRDGFKNVDFIRIKKLIDKEEKQSIKINPWNIQYAKYT